MPYYWWEKLDEYEKGLFPDKNGLVWITSDGWKRPNRSLEITQHRCAMIYAKDNAVYWVWEATVANKSNIDKQILIKYYLKDKDSSIIVSSLAQRGRGIWWLIPANGSVTIDSSIINDGLRLSDLQRIAFDTCWLGEA